MPDGTRTGDTARTGDAGARALDHIAVTDLFTGYADALDRRDWSALDEVFAEDVTALYGPNAEVSGRPAVVASIRAYLDRCGPSQHLIAAHRVRLDGDVALATAKGRIHHIGAGDRAALTYEVFCWYHASARRGTDGWRITSWRMEVTHELGTHEVFGGA